MSPRSFAVVVAVVLLLPVGVAPAAAFGGDAVASPAAQPGALDASAAPHNGSIDEGEIEMRVDVAPDGDARWRVKTVVSDSITTADERAAFRDLVDRFNESESPLRLDSFRAAADNASRATGREMTVRSVGRHHALHNGTGAVWITFTWTNFGETSGDRLAIDDAFNTTSGPWLSSLAASETLVVVPPSGYGISSAPTSGPAAASDLSAGTARWEGPQDFGQRGPWIVYSGDAPTPTPTATTARPPTGTATQSPDGPTTGPGTSVGGPDGDDGIAAALPFVVVVVLGGASAAVLVAYMRRDDEGLGGLIGAGGGRDDGATAAESAAAETDTGGGAAADSGDASPSADAAAEGAAAGGAAAAGADAAADDTAEGDEDEGDDGIDEELLSDEERVEQLIEANGGRMKQAAIVQETGWSNAKVSQLLSAMDEEGRIDKLRIGRENLISFPDEDVTDLDSE
ncbi:helix-turn-helix transcriptional regulator [Halosimplex marinum]|uniref:helix-turn-helix transcriptional regulator n=1 Tax=Halosimplex marinum TaxID=3396620 RepID=UPI003F579BFD